MRDHEHSQAGENDAANIQTARSMINGDATFIHETYAPSLVEGMDLVVIPLSFVGDREAIYLEAHPTRNAIIVGAPTRDQIDERWLQYKQAMDF